MAVLTAFVLMVASFVVGSTLLDAADAAAAPDAEAASRPTLQQKGWDPSWKTIPELKAVWLGADGQPAGDDTRVLSEDSVYWTSSQSTGNPGDQIGGRATILGESYDFDPVTFAYKTRPVMAFERTQTGPLTLSQSYNWVQFSTQAMARIGGTATDPKAPLSVYFWAHDGSDYINSTSFLDCSKISGYGPEGWISVVRVTDGSPDIKVGCMPSVRNTGDWNNMAPNVGNPYATGGEANQLNGYLYLQSMWGALDNQLYDNTSVNTSTQQFAIWDPVTGDYVQSGPVQPADFVQGQRSKERMKLRARVANANCPYGTNGLGAGCEYDDPNTAADFGLDAAGNLYMYTGTQINANDTNRGNSSLVRVQPSRDADGNFVNGSQAKPWAYSVVTKLKPARADMFMEDGVWVVGTAIHNGKLLGGGYVNTYYANEPTDGKDNNIYDVGDANAVASESRTASRMVRMDPVTGLMDIIGPVSTADNARTIDFNNPAPGYITSQVNVRAYLDNASPQMLTVIAGTVYNDQAADGAVAGDPGLANQLMALYAGDGTLLGTQTTSSTGGYQFVVSGAGNYFVRVVQAQVAGVNAVQTYAAVAGSLNTATVTCANGNISNGQSGVCNGAVTAPYADPAVTALGVGMDPATMPVHAAVTMTGDSEVATVDFGVSALGSFGDAAAGPATGTTVPVHVNGRDPQVWLGSQLGAYAGPAADGKAHNASDDGVGIASYAGKLPLAGSVLAATGTYSLTADVSGPAAGAAQVAGWVTGAGNNTWDTTARWTPVVADKVATGGFQFQSAGTVTGTPAVQFRANVSTAAQTQPTNAGFEYQASATSTTSWTTPGEIEDYSFTVADAVYRVGAHTTGGTGTFTVDGQTLTAGPATVVGTAKGLAAGKSQTITATAPATWQIVGATIKDTLTGAVIATPAVTPGASATITYTGAALGSDATIDVEYATMPDPAQSALTLDPPDGTAPVNSPVTVTATIVNAQGEPLNGVTVTFANASAPATTLSAPTCVTVGGECTVTINSAKAKKYADELAATVLVNGTPAAITGSPATVTFTAGEFSADRSTFTVTPNVTTPGGVPVAGVDSYTGTLTARDAGRNPLKDLALDTLDFTVSSPDVAVSAVTNNQNGTYTVEYTSTVAGTATASLTYLGTPVGTALPIPFVAGPPSVGPFTCADGVAGTSLSVDKTSLPVGGTALAQALVTDKFCNPVASTDVTFALAPGTKGTVTPLGPTAGDGLAFALVTDTVAETVTLTAAITAGDFDGSADITFTAGTFSAHDSLFTVTPDATNPANIQVVGTGFYTGTLFAKDAYDNAVTDLDVATIQFGKSAAPITVSSVVNAGDGKYQVEFKSTVADATATATVAVSGEPVGSARPIPFKAGGPSTACTDPARATALTVGPQKVAVGSPATATALVADEFCNPVPGVAVTFAVDGSATLGPDESAVPTVTAVTGADGTAAATLIDHVAEIVTVGATTPELTIGEGQVEFLVGGFSERTSTFEVTPDATNPANVQVVGTGKYLATLTARDADRNELENLDLTDIVFAASNGAYTITSVVNAGGGDYQVKFTSNVADAAATATVTFQGGPVGKALPVPFQAGAPTTGPFTCADGQARTSLSVDKTTLPVGGTATATALVTDEFCNPVPGVDVAFALGAGTQATMTPVTPTGADGVATAAVTDRKAETVELTATIEPETAAIGSPVAIIFRAGAFNATNSTFAVSPDATKPENVQPADGVAAYTGTLTARDAYGNPVAVDTAGIGFGKSAGYITVSGVTDAGEGTYWVTYTSTVADATATATVTVAGTPVGTAQPIPFQAGEASTGPFECRPGQASSNLRVDKANLTVGETATATALVTDRFCNPVKGTDVTFALAAGANGLVTPATGTTNADGLAQATVTDTTAERVLLHATVKDQNLPGSPAPIKFQAGTFSAADSAFTVTPDATIAANIQAVGRGVYLATLTARDTYGNPVTRLAGIEFGKSADYITVSAVTNVGDGTYTVTYTSRVADDTAEATVTVDGTPVGAARPVPFRAGEPSTGCGDPARTTALTVGPQEVGVGSPATATALVADEFCNPVPGVTVTFTATGAATLNPVSALTGADGRAVATVVDRVAETVTVGASAPDLPIGEGQVRFVVGGFSADTSTFQVTPDATDPANVQVVGTGSYTATLIARDAEGNALSDLDVVDIVFAASNAAYTQTGVVNKGNGYYEATFESTVADDAATATVAYQAGPV
ncbi:MAG: Ig-like domain-containing protein, partial [Propionibacteriaceae bacterium]|nr:Ig-like domain-containing protein [Propionibacteriaceae bacterium]